MLEQGSVYSTTNLKSGMILQMLFQDIISTERFITMYANMSSNIRMFGNIMPSGTV